MPRRIATIAAAVVLSLLGTALVVVYVGRADARAMEGLETVSVLVAAGPLAEGQTVASAQSAGLVGTQTLPRKVVPAEALTTFLPGDAELVFATAVTPGEVLQRPRLVAATEAQPDRLVIPEGRLAVTVELADPARVGGFVTVGSRIAVFDSYDTTAPEGPPSDDVPAGSKSTRVLLPDVTVLAVGRETSRVAQRSEDGEAEPAVEDPAAAMVTVAVDQREAEKLIHGAQTGTLYFGLLDTYAVTPGPGVDNDTLFDQ